MKLKKHFISIFINFGERLMMTRGLSNIVAGLAMALVIALVSSAVIPQLIERGINVERGVFCSYSSVSVFAFVTGSGYQVIAYNYGPKDVEKAYIIYNGSSGLEVYDIGKIPSGSYSLISIYGMPLSYRDSCGSSIELKVVNGK
jgi:hypothetical protein